MKSRTCLLCIAFLCGCGGSDAQPQLTGFFLQGMPTSAVAGDTLTLTPMQKLSDGTSAGLPTGAMVTWSGVPTVTTLSADSMANSPIPDFGADPVGFFISNPFRVDDAKVLTSLLVVADAGTKQGGTLQITGTISGTLSGTVSGTISIGAQLVGDAKRGQDAYENTCAICHGVTGHGTDANADGSFTVDHMTYDFPAPGLNAESGNAGSDPGWNAALFSMAARVDMDNGGLVLRYPMPSWLSEPNPETLGLLSTQDLADIYAFMQTQTM